MIARIGRGKSSDARYCAGVAAGAVAVGGGMSTRASQWSIVPAPTQLSVMSPAFSVAFEPGVIVPVKPLAAMRHAGLGSEFETSDVARAQVINAGPVTVNLSGCAPEFVSTQADIL